MSTAERALRLFMEGKPQATYMAEIEQPDVPLWCIWTLQQYAKEAGNEACLQRYFKLLIDLMDFIIANKHPNLRLKENGLVYAEGREKPCTCWSTRKAVRSLARG